MGAGEWAIWAEGTGGAKTLRNVWETEWKPVRLEQSMWEGGDGWSQRQQDGSWVVLPEKYVWEGFLFLLFFYNIFIYFVCIACGILVPRTRDRTHSPYIGSATSQPLDHQGSPVWGLPPTVPGGSVSKESGCQCRTSGWIPGQEDPLEKKMATHSSILAWKSHGQRSLMGLQSLGLQRAGYSSATKPPAPPPACQPWPPVNNVS